MTIKQLIPWWMAGLRVLLAPVMVIAAHSHWPRVLIAVFVLVALVSDIYDGVLARRWGCDTPAVRLFDSVADTIFYIAVAIALWIVTPEVWGKYWPLLTVLFALEVIRYGYDFFKFGKGASYHSYLAKTWGLVMAIGVIAVLGFNHWKPMIAVALILGIACDTEGFIMSLILPKWQVDVKTIAAAWRLRKEMMNED